MSKHSACISEHDEQVVLFKWAELMKGQYPELALMFAVPNGGDRNAIVGAKLKAEGVKRGVPDIILPVARGKYHALAIELKRANGSVLPNHQKWWIDKLAKQDWAVSVCKGAKQAMKIIDEYLKIPLLERKG